MLILSRRVGEVIKIGENVSVVILGLQGRQIRIGVEAPKEIPIHREEILDRIKLNPTSRTRAISPTI